MNVDQTTQSLSNLVPLCRDMTPIPANAPNQADSPLPSLTSNSNSEDSPGPRSHTGIDASCSDHPKAQLGLATTASRAKQCSYGSRSDNLNIDALRLATQDHSGYNYYTKPSPQVYYENSLPSRQEFHTESTEHRHDSDATEDRQEQDLAKPQHQSELLS